MVPKPYPFIGPVKWTPTSIYPRRLRQFLHRLRRRVCPVPHVAVSRGSCFRASLPSTSQANQPCDVRVDQYPTQEAIVSKPDKFMRGVFHEGVIPPRLLSTPSQLHPRLSFLDWCIADNNIHVLPFVLLRDSMEVFEDTRVCARSNVCSDIDFFLQCSLGSLCSYTSSPSIGRLSNYEVPEMNQPGPHESYEARRQESRSVFAKRSMASYTLYTFLPPPGHIDEKMAASLARCLSRLGEIRL